MPSFAYIMMYSSTCSCDIECWQSPLCTTEYRWTG